ncbi:uncharacterized protein LOC129003203 [Macrosteles quadrilineatus]|uniref:uncharacterized protein LOC129003203 n=1 Tax=Macrosteles quadrilineatus TaxID=74068 RepID=UPI0023E206A7|nr:uncharacterized protein LOC129003203 [Macrosteles quadrilineatus]
MVQVRTPEGPRFQQLRAKNAEDGQRGPECGGCQHDGKDYADGSEVTMADPCVRCRCSKGLLVCRLRVCNPLPHPPPRGCLVLTRRTECCPRLVCNQGPEEGNRRRLSDDFVDGGNSLNGCTVNGTVYAEGSAMDSSTRCHYCYCIKGQQHCVKPQCLLLDSECTPTYTPGSCCPTKYNCSDNSISDSTTTTNSPRSGCEVDGHVYPEGELIPNKGETCENCYCLKGRLHCEPVVCSVPVNRRCVPVVTPGHCCPTSYNCSGDSTLQFKEDQLYNEGEDMMALNTQNHLHVNSERSITGSKKHSGNKDQLIQTTQPMPADTTLAEEETSTSLETTTLKEESTTIEAETTETTEATTFETSIATEGDTTLIPSTTVVPNLPDVEERVNAQGKEEETTVKVEDVTTQISLPSHNSTSANNTKNHETTEEIDKHNSIPGPDKLLPTEIEAILNKTKLANQEEDYDYDYNEPSLPPSLPNLRIIPFVAADAVVDEPVYSPALEKSHSSDEGHHFYEIPHSSGFSPPAETEGGFVPKESLLDGPFYESKYDTVYHSSGAALGSANLDSLPSITEPFKTADDDKCVSGGRTYRHGELLTEPSACDLCVCYYGKILCQQPKCPVPDTGCHLSNSREPGSCCRKVVCNGNNIESPTRVVENATPAPHHPPFTIADVIVTPDPFRDVIRTEPAPDLPSLIGDIMPYLWDQTSSTSPVSLTTSEPMEEEKNTSNIVLTTSLPETTTTTLKTEATTVKPTLSTQQTSTQTTQTVEAKNKTEVTTKATDEYDYKEVKEEETNDDEFSLDSVFSYLFDSDKWTTKKPKTTSKPESKIQLKPTLTGIKSNESIPLVEQSLENRSDEDINKLTEINNSTKLVSVLPKTTTHSFLDDNKMHVVTEITKTTRRPAVYITTTEHSVTKSVSRTAKPSTHSKPVVSKVAPTIPSHSGPDPGAASGLLKLAGCNIYGRMYRVGRIISELSGPCLECMCTEVGVQCRPLKC